MVEGVHVPTGARHAFRVQGVGDRAGRCSGGVVAIDADHDDRLLLVDLEHALGDDAVAVAAPPAREALAHLGHQAAAGLVGERHQKQLVHGAR